MAAPAATVGSTQNLEVREYQPESKGAVLPWHFVTRDQALQACARVGKRLPTSAEWYALSLGLAEVHTSCNVNGSAASKTGSHNNCVSDQGVYDLVGNVWEWVSDDVIDGEYNYRTLPAEGYVAQVDATGIVTVTESSLADLFGRDYFWAHPEGAYGIIRGGYYDSGTDPGIYTAHADTVPTAASAGVGFRCVQKSICRDSVGYNREEVYGYTRFFTNWERGCAVHGTFCGQRFFAERGGWKYPQI